MIRIRVTCAAGALALASSLALAACSSVAPVAPTVPVSRSAGPERSTATVFLTPLVHPALDDAVSALESGPEIVSHAPRVTSESDRVGAYDQPEWTTHRRFARTRIYVLPEGQMELEQWWRGTFDKGEGPSHQFQTEIGIGLPGRFQVDLYGNYGHEDGTTKWIGLQPELRWAPADWGVIPLNPTLYLEYKWLHHEHDVAEGKILLGEEISPTVHWGMNLSVEQQLGGDKETELAVTQAFSTTLADRQLSLGVEFEYDRVTARGSRDDPEHQIYVGPSLQWRPLENVHVDIVPLKGFRDAHDWRVFVVVGWDFGGRAEKGVRAPVSAKSR